MNANYFNYFGIGIISTLIATVFLVGIVHRDLAPGVGLNGRGKLLLMAGLGGMGVLAFAAKLLVITLMLSMSGKIMSQMAKRNVPEHSAPIDFLINTANQPASYQSPYRWEALPNEAPVPTYNPMSPKKVALGKKLFFDKSLSRNGQVACASCHNVYLGAGVDGLKTSKGIDGQIGKRNAPTVWNAAFQVAQFWDGRASSLEDQSKGPLVNPAEMGMASLRAVEDRVTSMPEYRQAFQDTFGYKQAINIDNIAAAIASYERTLITPDSAYDRFVRGDSTALTPAQLKGMALFESAGCVRCHSGPNFSGASVFDGGSPYRIFPCFNTHYTKQYKFKDDVGKSVLGSSDGVWRIPSLRNVALTGPYFHNGSVSSLEESVRVMARTQLGRTIQERSNTERLVHWSESQHILTTIEKSVITDEEIQNIAAFLRALSSEKLLEQKENDPSSIAGEVQS